MKNSNSADFDQDDKVFARMAESYDRLCDFFSLYTHRIWKNKLAKSIANTPGNNFLDIAAGTGDIALRVALRLKKNNDITFKKNIILGDICDQMLDIARRKADEKEIECNFCIIDAHNLKSIPSASIDVVSISFAMKICDRAQVLSAVHRVLKPGGKFFCLEASRIPYPWLQSLYLLYMGLCIPMIANGVTKGDRSAYNYLLKGINDFPDKSEFVKEIGTCGFKDVTATPLSLGIVALHVGIKDG